MTLSLHQLLQRYRDASKNQREKGTYFESLTKAYLENDAVQISQYEKVWPYKDWATSQGIRECTS